MEGGRLSSTRETDRIALFVCANCARPGRKPTSAERARPVVPGFNLPGRVDRVVLPCAGRLQPEHVLKAFETGCRVVSVVACEEQNCHHAEGSRRCSLRVQYVRSLLEEIGLGEGRLVLAHLPGSALEDLKASGGRPAAGISPDTPAARLEGIRKAILEALGDSPPNPLAEPEPGSGAGAARAESLPPGGGVRHE